MYLTSAIVHNSCKSRSADYDIVGGDALGCQFASILQTTGLQYRDFIHVSFHNQVRCLAVYFSALGGQYSDSDSFSISVCFLQVYEIPFFVALDHKREAVLVAVRGTLSFKVSLWILSLLFVQILYSGSNVPSQAGTNLTTSIQSAEWTHGALLPRVEDGTPLLSWVLSMEGSVFLLNICFGNV